MNDKCMKALDMYLKRINYTEFFFWSKYCLST